MRVDLACHRDVEAPPVQLAQGFERHLEGPRAAPRIVPLGRRIVEADTEAEGVGLVQQAVQLAQTAAQRKGAVRQHEA